MLSSQTLVSGSAFKSSLYFELIFVNDVKVQFHSFACGYSVFPTPFIEESILSPLCVFCVLIKD